ncbi:hypothetical protein BGAL_0240g00030 [Botrytis galanthina]|uniref:Uncharacterized protein n=1 Tax=Botrytis galanthina TaxID=278940 RepID=A0A4S8R5U3_9HELO|nr:hypothetical protein BGAL_0240g00030 [Botrytis galanthina]
MYQEIEKCSQFNHKTKKDGLAASKSQWGKNNMDIRIKDKKIEIKLEEYETGGESKLRTKAKDSDDGMKTNSDGDADSDDYEDDIRANGPSAKAFYMPTTPRPSAQTPSLNYRWRGELREKKDNPENTGSRSIEYNSEATLHKITFMEPKGTKSTGTLR